MEQEYEERGHVSGKGLGGLEKWSGFQWREMRATGEGIEQFEQS